MNYGVEFRNISKRYGVDASAPLVVKSISFEIEQGTLTTILGPSGLSLIHISEPTRPY